MNRSKTRDTKFTTLMINSFNLPSVLKFTTKIILPNNLNTANSLHSSNFPHVTILFHLLSSLFHSRLNLYYVHPQKPTNTRSDDSSIHAPALSEFSNPSDAIASNPY